MNNASIGRMQRSVRLSNRELIRRAKTVVSSYQELEQKMNHVHTMLMVVLAQAGGEVTVTQGTMAQIFENMGKLDFEFKSSDLPNEFKIRLVTGTEVIGVGSLNQAAPGTINPEKVQDDPQ